MQAKAIINGYDITPWIKQDGFSQSPIIRCGRSVITMDGTLKKTEIIKRGAILSLVEIRDATLNEIVSAITSPAEFNYTDLDKGDRTASFYVSLSGSKVKTVRGGNTYWSGVTVELEEV